MFPRGARSAKLGLKPATGGVQPRAGFELQASAAEGEEAADDMSGDHDSGDGDAPRPRVSLFGRASKPTLDDPAPPPANRHASRAGWVCRA